MRFHRAHGKLATVTAVRPPARFGGLAFDGTRVAEFTEKPQVGEGWINGGFFVLEREAIRYIDGDETLWERDPLERLAADGQLHAYTHDGFWQPMDTLRDRKLLEELWAGGARAVETMGRLMDWDKSRVFVTGATGIVGSWLVKRLLEQGAYVLVMVRDGIRRANDPQRRHQARQCLSPGGWKTTPRSNARSMNTEIDTVFHLGAQRS